MALFNNPSVNRKWALYIRELTVYNNSIVDDKCENIALIANEKGE